MTVKSESYFGGGDMLIDRLDSNGLPTGYRLESSVSEFSLQPKFEKKQQFSKGRGSKYGQEIASINVPGETVASWVLQKFSSFSLAQAVLSNGVTGTQESGTLTDAEVVAKAGFYVEIGKYKLSNVVVKDETDATTYEEGIDYYVDEDYGLLMAIAGRSIADAATLHVSGDYAAFDYTDITPGDGTSILLRVRYLGENRVNGKLSDVLCLQVSVDPVDSLPFQGDDFITLAQSGVCQLPDGATYAFRIRQEN